MELECTKIMKPVFDAGLAKTHVFRHFPHDVVYGPKHKKGLGFSNLFLLQGILHISVLQHYLDVSDNITGSFLCNSIELLKVELRLGKNLFTLSYED